MSATGSMFIGIVGAVVFLLAVFAFSQRNWKNGCVWLLIGLGIIALLTYLDRPSSAPWRSSAWLGS
jgi:predicted cobalt transporter CbtA